MMPGMEPAQLHYSIGNEHDPSDPFGRCDLVIETDGLAQLDQVQPDGEHHWSGRVTPEARGRLFTALERGGFPAVPPYPWVSGAALRRITIGAGSDRQAAMVEYHVGRCLPGYAEAFAVIDAILHQLSAGAVETAAASTSVVVSDVIHA